MIFHSKHLIKLLYVYIVILLMTACDSFMPSDLKEQTRNRMSGPDKDACSYLLRELTTVDTVVTGPDTSYIVTNHFTPVFLTYLEGSIDSFWVNASDPQISALYDTMITDTINLVSNPDQQKTGYALYHQPSQKSSSVTFFISWELTQENLNAYIKIEVYAKNGQRIPLINNDIDIDNIAGCTQEVLISGIDEVYPKIRSRDQFEFEEGYYLIKFSISEAEKIENYRVVIL